MTLIGLIITDQIRVDPSNPRHPRSIPEGLRVMALVQIAQAALTRNDN